MWTPGPFEARPLRAFYYITDVEPTWPIERKNEHLRDFNYGALWSISIHEVFPGHFLHYQHLRQVDSGRVSAAIRDRVGRVRRPSNAKPPGFHMRRHAARSAALR